MKKKVVLGAALMMMPLVSFAGGYLTNTNQHAAFLRSLSRGAAIDIYFTGQFIYTSFSKGNEK